MLKNLMNFVTTIFLATTIMLGISFILLANQIQLVIIPLIAIILINIFSVIIIWSAYYEHSIRKKNEAKSKDDLMTCPHCGSIDSDYLSSDTDCEYPEWTYKCRECGTKWTEYAELKYVGCNIINEENNN
jgi:DNA-directed RNA polymerase subunit RPC12/RpoP